MNEICPWSGWAVSEMHFCEARLCAWIAEPANAWSNLAYVMAGIFIFALGRNRELKAFFAIASVCLGIFSFAFHASGTQAFHILDVASMHMMSLIFCSLNLVRLNLISRKNWQLVYWIVNASILASMILIHEMLGLFVFGASLAIAILLELYCWRKNKTLNGVNFGIAIAIFGLAFAIWLLDKTGVWCEPDRHWLQGHAIWHLLCAVVICFMYRHFQSTEIFKKLPHQ